MNKIIKNKLPKKSNNITAPNFRRTEKFEWYYNFLFIMFLFFGINVYMNPKIFRIGLMIKIVWLMIIAKFFYNQPHSFTETFLIYAFAFTYLFHFYDIFMIFFFALFVPKGNRLLEE